MFQSVLILLAIIVILYVAHLCLRAYTNKTLSWQNAEPFKGVESQAAAPQVQKAPVEPPRVVMPSGPNPPNAESPQQERRSPEKTVPNDPMDDVNSATPLRDSMRHPENSFGPGVSNTGNQISLDSGISSKTVNSGISQFSPEFAQNGGEFMSGVQAVDAFGGDNYASL
jgi:hypothetical protein